MLDLLGALLFIAALAFWLVGWSFAAGACAAAVLVVAVVMAW
jgi:hypothetical protein